MGSFAAALVLLVTASGAAADDLARLAASDRVCLLYTSDAADE